MNAEAAVHENAYPLTESCFTDELQQFVGTCQVLSAAVSQRERGLGEIAKTLSAALPRPRCSADFLLLRSIVVEFATRAVEATGTVSMDTVLRLVRLQPSDEPLGQSLVHCLSAVSLSTDGASHADSVQARRARRVLSAITLRCFEPDLHAGAIAMEVQLSPRCLGRLLHEHFNMGFRTALRQARVAAAHKLLAQSTYSVKEIAAQVGYSSTSQFDRDFRRVCGVTPGEYRSTHAHGARM